MKVVIVLNTAWNAYNFRGLIIRKLLQEQHSVTLIAPYDEFVPRLEQWGVRHVDQPLEASGLNPLRDLQFLRQLKRKLREEAPDIILSYTIKPNIYGALAAKRLNIPIICNVSGLGTTFLWKGWVNVVAKTLYRRAFKNVDCIFFQNADDQKLLLEKLALKNVKTGLVPGSGIDLKAFYPAEAPTDPFTFLMISRLLVEKGIREFLEASKVIKSEFPGVKIQLIGSYDPLHKRSVSPEIFNEINQGDPIAYLGETDDIRSAIQKAHCIVLPSYREGTPRTLLEGAAMGKPLIATDVPGCREVIDDRKNGFLCKSQDVSSLHKVMKAMLELSESDRSAFGKNSRRLVEKRFDENLVWKKYRDQIQELVSVRFLAS